MPSAAPSPRPISSLPTVNAFTVSYLALIGVGAATALVIFSIQSACHALFPLVMGGIAERVGVKSLLVVGLVMQAAGMIGLAFGFHLPMLVVFAIGVGGGYGTVFLAHHSVAGGILRPQAFRADFRHEPAVHHHFDHWPGDRRPSGRPDRPVRHLLHR